MSTLEEALATVNAAGWRLDCLRQLNTNTWYARLRQSDSPVYFVTTEAYAPTATRAVGQALQNAKAEAA